MRRPLNKPKHVFHVSEEPDIARFVPRPSPRQPNLPPMVWAIDETRLVNYLLPRDCPRVTFYSDETTTTADRQRFLQGTHTSAVVIESAWWERVQSCQLTLYQFDSHSFRLFDPIAGYWVSEQTVVPKTKRLLVDPVQELIGRGVEFRILPSLWALRDAVVDSTLQFSIIRMRHAQTRPSH